MIFSNTFSRSLTRLIVLLIIGLPLAAQAQTGAVRGTLLDVSTSQPVPFASVVLLRAQDSSFVAGAQTAETGAFALEKLPFGTYTLRATVIGYRAARKTISVTAAAPTAQLGTLRLRSSATQLAGVTVQGERAVVTDNLDKKVIDVSKDLSVTGGTATDVLQNVPSVTVDQNGSVSLRGSGNVTIFVDGKPTVTTLDQIPASSIQNVEVVTNPSARYDASGTAGIINIVLKKQNRDGLNGLASVNVGTKDKYNTSLGLNYRQGKWNVFGSYDFRQDRRIGYGTQDQTIHAARLNGLTDQTLLLHQDRSGVNYNTAHAGRLGLDYDLTPTQTLTLAVQPRFNRQSSIEDILSNQRDRETGQNTVLGTNQRNNTSHGSSRLADFSLDYRRKWASQKGRELTANAVYTPARSQNTVNSTIYYPRSYSHEPRDSSAYQQQHPITTTNQASAQADYVQPVGEQGRFETGVRSTWRQYDTDYHFLSAPALRFDPSNRFVYKQYVQAGYFTYVNGVGKLHYQAGLRAEQTALSGTQVVTSQRFTRRYFDLFPSAVLAYEVSKENRAQLSYSKRISRPEAGELNPFTDRSDQLNLVTGNPRLLPEYTHALELGDQKFFGETGSVSATAFYRLETNTAQGFRRLLNDSLNLDPTTGRGYLVSSTTRLNLGKETSYGLELVGSMNLTPFWKVNANASAFRRLIRGAALGTEINNSNYVYTGRLNSTISPTKKLDLQAAVNYRSPIVSAQGLRQAFFNVDLAAKQNILKDKASITLRVSDIFNTLHYNFTSYGPGFETVSHNKRESRIALLGFTYRFGNTKQLEQRSRQEQPDDNGGGGFQ